jgi:hypothetical protein
MAKKLVIPNLNGLESVEDVIQRVGARKARRHDVYMDNPTDLGFTWHEVRGEADGDFFMTIDKVEMRLTEGALKTAAMMIGQKNPKWFSRFADENFLPKSFRNFGHQTGFLIRHDGREIQAVLPDSYRVRDAYELLHEDFLPSLEDNIGGIRGIAAVEEGDGDLGSYRVVCGDNILPGVADDMGQYMMFLLSTSENGLAKTQAWIGTYRSISQTAALRGQTGASWGHKNEGTRFFDRTGEAIQGLGIYRQQFGGVMVEMAKTSLPSLDDGKTVMAPEDVLGLLHRGKLLTKSHYDAAKQYATQLTEDKRKVSTEYDLFNCCTKGAQELENVQQRQKAEEQSMAIFTGSGGLVGNLMKALEKVPDGEPQGDDD